MRRHLASALIAALALAPFGAMAQGISQKAPGALQPTNVPTAAPPANGTQSPTQQAEKETPAPIAQVNCALADPKNYSAGISKDQSDQKEALLRVSVNHCRFRISETGISRLSAQIVLDLNENADVRRCQSFLIYFLFEITADQADFGWGPYRVEIKEAAVASVSGREQSLKLFLLHNQSAANPVILRDLLSPQNQPPNFDDLYWGEVEIFAESPGGSFPRELESKLPKIGKGNNAADYSLNLTIKTFQPRGLCFFRSTDDATAKLESTPIMFADEK